MANILLNVVNFLKNPNKYGILKDNKLYLEFDTIVDCNYERSLQITDFPFESKNGMSRITEYMYPDPDTFTIKAFKSRSSLLTNKLINADNEIKQIEQKLSILSKGIYRLQIKTRNGLRQYFTLQKFNMPETYDNFGMLEISMIFKQVITGKDWNNVQRNIEDTNTINGGNLSAKIITRLL